MFDIGLWVLLIVVASVGVLGAVLFIKGEIIDSSSYECKPDKGEHVRSLNITTDMIDPSKITTANIIHSKEDVDVNFVDEYMQEYFDALEAKDPKRMQAALIAKKEHCGQANSYCLDEVFCPECPFGALPVQSGRAGM